MTDGVTGAKCEGPHISGHPHARPINLIIREYRSKNIKYISVFCSLVVFYSYKKGSEKMKITKLEEPLYIDPKKIVRLTEMGNITEIMYSETRSKGGYITKLDNEYYCDNRTGEVKEFQHIENRSQDLQNVAKSLKRLRDLLNANITDVSCCRWLTFTYADNMTDPKKLAFDFKNCVKRLRDIFGKFEYITAAEPQGRGAWHLHCVFIFSGKAPYMANDVVANAWKKGFVTVKRLDDVDNVGAYLTAYLGDMELSEVTDPKSLINNKGIKEVEYTDENGKKAVKKYIKGARLCMYPPKFNIYRKSKGIKEPTISLVPYEIAKEKASSAKLTFSKTVALEDEETDFKNNLQYEYYNSIRK